jgi:hypothetical protein
MGVGRVGRKLSLDKCRGLFFSTEYFLCLPQQLRQLGDIRRDPPRLILRKQGD